MQDFHLPVIWQPPYEILHFKSVRILSRYNKTHHIIPIFSVFKHKVILLNGHQGLEGLIREEWGYSSPITLILVTDGGIGFGPYSLHNLVTGKLDEEVIVFILKFSFPFISFYLGFPLNRYVTNLG